LLTNNNWNIQTDWGCIYVVQNIINV